MGAKSTDRSKLEVAVEEEAAYKRRLTITVPAGRVVSARRREQRKLGKSLRVKGFRKGKVPPQVVEQRYGQVIDQRTLNTLIEQTFREALEERDLRPIGEPSIGNVQYSAGDPLTFQVEIEIMPEVQLQRTGGFRIKRPEVEAPENEVDELIGRLRRERAVLEPVDRSPEEGDVVSVRIGEPSADWDEAAEGRPYRFELGAGMAIPDVEAAICSLEPGAAGEFDVRYPDDFDDPELAGSERRLRVELVDVKTKRLPELTDEFASEVGDFDTLAELRDAVRDDVRRHHEDEADRTVREGLVDALIEANPFEVPPALIANYLDQVLEVPEGADPEEVRSARRNLEPAAERQIKRQFIVEHLVEEHGLAPTEEEVEARIREMADRRDMAVADLKRQLAREQRLDALRRQMAADKAFELLESQSTIE